MELILSLFKYGKDYRVFVGIPQFENLLFYNPRLPEKYFANNVAIPSVIPDGFEKEKRKNTCRIFVLGGSSAAGFPYPYNASFPRQLKRKLEILYPELFIEAVNLSVSALNSNSLSDIIDDVLEQEPDLILIYSGHNEYYGADGAASAGVFGGNADAARILNFIRELKTYQLFSELIFSAAGIFSNVSKDIGGRTLMAEMAGENLVELNTHSYERGIKQFRSNLEKIILSCREENVNIILSTLTSNLFQKPLDSIIKEKNEALIDYEKAIEALNDNNIDVAKNRFINAKEKDSFRFRAPSAINSVIIDLAQKYNVPVADIEKDFLSKSKNGITDFNLFSDHLHPNIEGYRIMADSFGNVIDSLNLLDSYNKTEIDPPRLANILLNSFPFTRIDSAFSDMRIKILTNSYPFTSEKNAFNIIRSFRLKNYSDTLAYQVINNDISWEEAHYQAADYFIGRKNYRNYFFEMWALIEDKTFERSNYFNAVHNLYGKGEYSLASAILLKYHRNYPDKFSTKYLGLIALEQNNYKRAVKYFNESINYSGGDAELYFKLSTAYFMNGEIEMALKSIKKCIEINKAYPGAEAIYQKLITLSNSF